MRLHDIRRGGATLLLGWALAGCATTPAPAPAAAVPPPAKPHLPGIVLGPQQGENGMLGNDPPAPAGSPVCGPAARESDAISQALLPRRTAEAGICASYTCYDPATATYLGADGYRHVCR